MTFIMPSRVKLSPINKAKVIDGMATRGYRMEVHTSPRSLVFAVAIDHAMTVEDTKAELGDELATISKIAPAWISLDDVYIFKPLQHDLAGNTLTTIYMGDNDPELVRSLARHLTIKATRAPRSVKVINAIRYRAPALSFLKISGLEELFSPGTGVEWVVILNKHLGGDRNILACQEELIDAGLEEMASI
jgi:hypothetical protein